MSKGFFLKIQKICVCPEEDFGSFEKVALNRQLHEIFISQGG